MKGRSQKMWEEPENGMEVGGVKGWDGSGRSQRLDGSGRSQRLDGSGRSQRLGWKWEELEVGMEVGGVRGWGGSGRSQRLGWKWEESEVGVEVGGVRGWDGSERRQRLGWKWEESENGEARGCGMEKGDNKRMYDRWWEGTHHDGCLTSHTLFDNQSSSRCGPTVVGLPVHRLMEARI